MQLPNPMQMMINQIKQNPNIANNPNAMHYLQVLESGDAEEGRKIAENLCKEHGMTPEEAMQQAQSMFAQGKFPFQ